MKYKNFSSMNSNKIVVVSELFTKDDDIRPHAKVDILGIKIVGLLDSGATCSILGRDCKKLVSKLGLRISEPLYSVRTADGSRHLPVGTVDLPITFKNKSHLIPTIMVPSMSQSLILGMDFWKKFKIRPEIAVITPDYVIKTEHILNARQKRQLEEVIEQLPLSYPNKLGRTKVVSHVIDTGDMKPVRQRPYLYSPAIEKDLFNEIDRMIALDVIERSISPWCSPLVCAHKPNGKLRVCLDSRRLNVITKKDSYPLPHINRILGRLRETKILSTIDLKDAFWQVPLEEQSREKTAFSVAGRGHFQFKVMPFGLCNAAQTQARLMDVVLGYDLEPYVFVYLDNIVIMSRDFAHHILLLKEVTRRITRAGLTVNIDKCLFCRKELKYLGYIISEDGLRPDTEKITPVLNFPTPTNVSEVRQFIGMAGWYRRFIRDFASLSAPITDLTKNPKQKFAWSQDASTSFIKLKTALVSAPVLRNPDFMKEFTVQADSSDYGIGAVLTQGVGEEEYVVAYFSQKLNPRQRRYTVTEKECLAVLASIEKFRCYIEGVHFKVITDHASLLWLRNLKDPTGRLGRWAIKLQQYDFDLIHRKGKNHIVPDALSRNLEVSELLCESAITQDDYYRQLMEKIKENPSDFADHRIDNDLIYKHVGCGFESRWVLIVPSDMRKSILEKNHDECNHYGYTKTLKRIRERYTWPKIALYVKDYVLNCKTCKASKHPNQANSPPMGSPKVAKFPWQIVSMDFYGSTTRSTSGYQHVLVISDWFSKYTILRPCGKQNAKFVCKTLEKEIFLERGVPESIVSDNHSVFVGKEVTALLEKYKVKAEKNASYHPQHNPAERIMSVLSASLRSKIIQDQTRWSDHLAKIQFAMNTAYHESTRFSPYYILHGMNMITSGDEYKLIGKDVDSTEERSEHLKEIRSIVKRNIATAYERYSKYYNLRARPVSFKAGDIVWRRNNVLSDKSKNIAKKLTKLFIECRILRKMGSCSYEIADLNGKYVGIYHAKDLKA